MITTSSKTKDAINKKNNEQEENKVQILTPPRTVKNIISAVDTTTKEDLDELLVESNNNKDETNESANINIFNAYPGSDDGATLTEKNIGNISKHLKVNHILL